MIARTTPPPVTINKPRDDLGEGIFVNIWLPWRGAGGDALGMEEFCGGQGTYTPDFCSLVPSATSVKFLCCPWGDEL
jgi:hypothetical protein